MPLLEADSISVSFGGIKALADVSIAAEPGAVTGLIGPNGAGKSTMLGVLSGLQRPKAGRVRFAGHDVTRKAPHRRARLGMARTFQRLELWSSMTVAENVLTAAELGRQWNRDAAPQRIAGRALEQLGLTTIADVPVGELSSGQGRLVEVARAMALRPTMLLLDEPSAGLNEVETEELGRILASLAADGTAIILVEHHVELVTNTCSYVYVLDFGQTIAAGPPEQIRRDEAVQRAYLGSKHAAHS
ncbi:ABC transporter ATP-binding protein [Conexibacter sp. CPCC 206217]|uniref:ABC transporter ATP-binding protein n=1 Tax=Conexibacter sp. CPCC 206217 TaxID=3064574 RepID=UPI0027183659|nr:ABC transporter ATP-binding protein [Conexibacter sp. CPCC 206217]MDO8212011.1 ABC transporter ATP-binding protein [Conexibacter sp. CPCC 206217]